MYSDHTIQYQSPTLQSTFCAPLGTRLRPRPTDHIRRKCLQRCAPSISFSWYRYDIYFLWQYYNFHLHRLPCSPRSHFYPTGLLAYKGMSPLKNFSGHSLYSVPLYVLTSIPQVTLYRISNILLQYTPWYPCTSIPWHNCIRQLCTVFIGTMQYIFRDLI